MGCCSFVVFESISLLQLGFATRNEKMEVLSVQCMEVTALPIILSENLFCHSVLWSNSDEMDNRVCGKKLESGCVNC